MRTKRHTVLPLVISAGISLAAFHSSGGSFAASDTTQPGSSPTADTTSNDSGSGALSPAASAAVEACASRQPYAAEAQEMVDTSEFKTDEDWVIGISTTSTTANSYLVYFTAELEYALSTVPQIGDVILLSAEYDASKQISDIQSLIRQDVDILLFAAVDAMAIQPVLQEAVDAGIPTVQMLSSFAPDPAITATVTVDLWQYYSNTSAVLFDAMGGSGEVAMLRTIAGISEDAIQTGAVDCILEHFPDIEIVDEQYASYNTAPAQTAAQAWAVRFPNLKGVLSVYAETSIGVYNAFRAAGRIDDIMISPGNVQNGWLRIASANPAMNLGGVSYPVSVGEDAVAVASQILSGEPVPVATLSGGDYIDPETYAAAFDPDEPDSYWPNSMPDEFQPS